MDIQEKINKLCSGCMNTHDKIPCEHCNFDENAYLNQLQSHILRPRTILNGKYITGKVLGEGGFGITYLGLDLNLELKLAIKEYYPSGYARRDTQNSNEVQKFTGEKSAFFDKGLTKFLEEAKNVAKFSNAPGIVRVVDFFRENGTAYMVMEYVEGITLKQYLKNNGGRISYQNVLNMMMPVISSLALVHQEGIIHRDISPDNIMIDSYGNMKVIDFGAARDFADENNKSMSILLKPGFAPEEQYRSRGHQGPWSDVYALCATIYKMITGITPVESLERRAEDTLVPLSNIDRSIPITLSNTISQGMAVLQENRIQDMRQLYSMLYGQDLTSYAGHTVNTTFKSGMYENHTKSEYTSQSVYNPSNSNQSMYIPPNPNQQSMYNPQNQGYTQSNQSMYIPQNENGDDKSKKNKKLIILVSSLLVLLCIGIGIGTSIGKKGEDPYEKQIASNSEYKQQEEPKPEKEPVKEEPKKQETEPEEKETQTSGGKISQEDFYNELRNIVKSDLENVNEYSFYFCDVNEKKPLVMNGIMNKNGTLKALGIAHLYLMAEVGNQLYPLNNSLKNKMYLAMTRIDDASANATRDLIRRVGIKNIDNNIKRMGLSYKTRFRRTWLDNAAERAGHTNTTVAMDAGTFMKNLYNDHKNPSKGRSALTKDMKDPTTFCNDMMYYMSKGVQKQNLRYGIPRLIEDSKYVKGIYDKNGVRAKDGYYNDVAIVETDRGTYVICLLTKGGPYKSQNANQLKSIQKISLDVFNAYLKYKK